MYGMSLWFRAYGIPFSALTANLTMIPKGAALRVSLNFDALALACRDKTLTSIENVYFCSRKRLIHIA